MFCETKGSSVTLDDETVKIIEGFVDEQVQE